MEIVVEVEDALFNAFEAAKNELASGGAFRQEELEEWLQGAVRRRIEDTLKENELKKMARVQVERVTVRRRGQDGVRTEPGENRQGEVRK
ncbi:MAG TPA: hypothetical protein VLH56_08490 [Dissulfurispiraceae bacterium]|nr:hypothetical protein [Dissulfurispiraceae bacterium]